jgi:hypothetical protein
MSKLVLDENITRLYAPSARYVSTIEVPELKFLMIDGIIEEGENLKTSESFQIALNVLSGISFTLKFMSKLNRKNPIDYNIMPMEALWQTNPDGDLNNRGGWSWTLMSMQPEHITQEMVNSAVESLRKKQGQNPTLDSIRCEKFTEGLAIQIMHVGSQELAPMTFDRMKDYAKYKKYKLTGIYHEIYISDPRHEHPDKERTIIRYPVQKPEELDD